MTLLARLALAPACYVLGYTAGAVAAVALHWRELRKAWD